MANERKAYAERRSLAYAERPGYEPAAGSTDPTALERCIPLQWGAADLVNEPAIVNDQQEIPIRKATTYSQPLPNKYVPRGSQTPNAGIPGNGGWDDFKSGAAVDLLPAELVTRNT